MYDECYAYSCVYIIRLRYLSALAVTNSASVANWSKSRHHERLLIAAVEGSSLVMDWGMLIADPIQSASIIVRSSLATCRICESFSARPLGT